MLIAQAARAAAHQNSLSEVMAYLERQGEIATANGLQWRLIKVHALRALVYQVRGDATQAQACLAQALALAGSPMGAEGNIRIFVDEGEAMRLLILAFKGWLTRSPPDTQQRYLLAYIDQLIDAFSPAQGLNASSLNPPHPPRQPSKLADDHEHSNQALIEPLTARELEVLQLIAAGHSNREIARTLVVSLGHRQKAPQQHLWQTRHREPHADRRAGKRVATAVTLYGYRAASGNHV